MKKVLIAVTVVSLLSITSIGSADRGDRNERQMVRSNHDSPVIGKLIIGSSRYLDHREKHHSPRYVEKNVYKKRGRYGDKVVMKKTIYRMGHDRPYWKSVKYDKHRNDRHHWRDRYDRHDRHDRHDRFDRDERRDRLRR